MSKFGLTLKMSILPTFAKSHTSGHPKFVKKLRYASCYSQ